MPDLDAMSVHYELELEHERLFRKGTPSLEFVRSMELLNRFLPKPPAHVADVGGGTGAYSAPLASTGYEVTLVEPIELHVKKALEISAGQPSHPFTAILGDARKLDLPSDHFDAVLFFGPLYHLTERVDRITALREAARVLKPGGILLAVGISRFRSLLGGLVDGKLHDEMFRPIVERDLIDGQHRNPDPANHPEFFTTAYFHLPQELVEEVSEVGFQCDGPLAVEGPGWIGHWSADNEEGRADALFAARSVEREPSLVGLTTHMLVVGTKS